MQRTAQKKQTFILLGYKHTTIVYFEWTFVFKKYEWNFAYLFVNDQTKNE